MVFEYILDWTESMISFSYLREDGKRILDIHWLEKLTDEDVLAAAKSVDEIQFWYPMSLPGIVRNLPQQYISFVHQNQTWGIPSQTGITDLTVEIDDLFKGFGKNEKYEINRAENRDKVFGKMILKPDEQDLEEFFIYYDQFADTKGLRHIDKNLVKSMAEEKAFVVSKVYDEDNKLLSTHSYILDKGISRAFLNTSSSMVHEIEDSEIRRRIGRANRWLHYFDMRMLKEHGISIYDWGGINWDTNVDAAHNAISDFKKGFHCIREDSKESVVVETYPFKDVHPSSILTKKKIVLFGAGDYLRQTYPYIKDLYDVIAVSDNSSQKWGKTVGTLKIIRPDEIAINKPDAVIVTIMNSTIRDKIIKQICQMKTGCKIGWFSFENGPHVIYE